jgi:putative glutamine amidotransferase
LAVARVAIEDRIRLFAICRANQVVKVARGGGLIQELTDRADEMAVIDAQCLDIVEDSPRCARSCPRHEMTISCYHHQGVSSLGKGLRASA